MKTHRLNPMSGQSRQLGGRGERLSTQIRRGSAELELIMVLPILAGFVFAMMWLGMAMETQSRMIVQARHDAWSERSNPSGAPFQFSSKASTRKEAQEQVKYTPWANHFTPSRASSSIMTGAWDHREINLNTQPNFKTFRQLLSATGQDAVKAWDGGIGGIKDILEMLKQEVEEKKNSWAGADIKEQAKSLKDQALAAVENFLTGQSDKILKEIANLKKRALDLLNPIKLLNKIDDLREMVDSIGDAIGDLKSL